MPGICVSAGRFEVPSLAISCNLLHVFWSHNMMKRTHLIGMRVCGLWLIHTPNQNFGNLYMYTTNMHCMCEVTPFPPVLIVHMQIFKSYCEILWEGSCMVSMQYINRSCKPVYMYILWWLRHQNPRRDPKSWPRCCLLFLGFAFRIPKLNLFQSTRRIIVAGINSDCFFCPCKGVDYYFPNATTDFVELVQCIMLCLDGPLGKIILHWSTTFLFGNVDCPTVNRTCIYIYDIYHILNIYNNACKIDGWICP